MTASLKFIHTSDLHLGTSFKGVRSLSSTWKNKLVKAIPEAFDRVISAAIEHQVDFLIISGDIFDSDRVSYGDYLRFFEGIKILSDKGIPTYLCTGNHDPYSFWQKKYFELPESAYLFQADAPSFTVYERDGEPLCLLGGRGFKNQFWTEDYEITDGITRKAAEESLSGVIAHPDLVPYAIGVAHTGLTVDKQIAPSDPQKLANAGMDYWALGHIHQTYLYPSPDNPRVVFSGCIQGRDINETGMCSCFLVELKEGQVNRLTPIPTSSVVWEKPEVSIEGCTSLPKIKEKILAALNKLAQKNNGAAIVARVTLTGVNELHQTLTSTALDDLRNDINDSSSTAYLDALEKKTKAPIDLDAVRKEGMFPATFLTISDKMKENPQECLAYIQDLFAENNLRFDETYTEDFSDLLGDAQELILDKLLRKES
ncbi:MAG: metallophosphoesterase family protein [Eggerthellaceae bacterium]|jgi:exonuclease SbcD